MYLQKTAPASFGKERRPPVFGAKKRKEKETFRLKFQKKIKQKVKDDQRKKMDKKIIIIIWRYILELKPSRMNLKKDWKRTVNKEKVKLKLDNHIYNERGYGH